MSTVKERQVIKMFEFGNKLIPYANINWVERADEYPYDNPTFAHYDPNTVRYTLTIYLKYPTCGLTHFRKIYNTREERDQIYEQLKNIF